jgi:hypothetical protein
MDHLGELGQFLDGVGAEGEAGLRGKSVVARRGFGPPAQAQ